MVGARYHVIWSVIGIASTVLGSFGAFAPWAYGTGRRQPAHPGRTDMLRDLSAQSDESASTMSSSSASAISGLCYTTTRAITMNVERTCRWTRMLQSRAQFRPAAVLLPALFLADCTINIAEFEFSIGTGAGWFWCPRRRGFAPKGKAMGPFPTNYSAYRDALLSSDNNRCWLK